MTARCSPGVKFLQVGQGGNVLLLTCRRARRVHLLRKVNNRILGDTTVIVAYCCELNFGLIRILNIKSKDTRKGFSFISGGGRGEESSKFMKNVTNTCLCFNFN